MEMREEEVDGKRPRAAAVHEGCAELAQPGASIKNEKRSRAVANFNARGVAAVAHRERTGRRDGPAGTPEPALHLMLTIWSPDLARKGPSRARRSCTRRRASARGASATRAAARGRARSAGPRRRRSGRAGGGADLLALDPLEPQTPADHLRVSGHALAVSGGLLIARVDRHGKGFDERRPKAPLLGHELRVLDRNRGRRPERAQRVLVIGGEGAAAVLVYDLEHADDAPVLAGHRERQQGLRAVPGAMIGLGVKAGIFVGVGDVDPLARCRDGSRDADSDRLPDLARTGPKRDLRPDLGTVAIDDEDRGAVGVEQLRRDGRHVPKERIQIGDRHEPARNVQDEIELRPRGDSAFGLAARLGTTFRLLSALLRHQFSMGMCSSTGPTVSAICSSSIWSRRSKAPLRWVSAWITPTTLCPSLPHTGTTSMFNVRNPVRRSTFRSKRASA